MKPIEHQLRPKGLGLEADRSALKDLEPNKRQRPPKPGEDRAKEEELVMGPGGCVLVQSGAHKDLYGKVGVLDNPLSSDLTWKHFWYTEAVFPCYVMYIFLNDHIVITVLQHSF